MDTLNSLDNYNKIAEPKVVDTVRIFGKYIDASAFKSRIIAAASALVATGVVVFVIFF